MAEKELIDPSFVNMEFWKAWPKKISNIQKYEQKREVLILLKKVVKLRLASSNPGVLVSLFPSFFSF